MLLKITNPMQLAYKLGIFIFLFGLTSIYNNAFSQKPQDLLNSWNSTDGNPGCDQWKITWPTGDEEKQLCNDVDNNRKEFYYVNNSGNGIVFRTPIRSNNGTTPNSENVRCELREREPDGSKDAFWTTSGEHVIYVKQAITHLPINKDELVATQIHGNKSEGIDDAMVVRLEGKNMFLNFNGGKLRSDVTIKSNYNLGTVHEVIFQVINGKHYCYYSEDGKLKSAFANGNADSYLVKSSGNAVLMDINYGDAYFRAGNYTQSNPNQEGSDTNNSNNYGEVVLYDLVVDHKGEFGQGGPPNSGPTNPPSDGCTAVVPGSRTVTNTGQSSATVSWNYDDSFNHYNVRYRKTGNSNWTTKTSLRESENEFDVSGGKAFYDITGLNNDTTYEWQVRAKCDDTSIATSYAAGQGPNFTTDDSGNNNPPPTNNGRSAYSKIEAESYDSQNGIKLSNGGKAIGYIGTGDWVKYDNVDFENGAASVTAQLSKGNGGTGKVEFRKGSTSGTILGQISIGNTGGWTSFKSYTANISNSSGTHDLYLVFTGSLDVDYFQFSKDSSNPPSGGCTASTPSNRKVGNVTSSSAVVTWNTNGADNYDVRFKKVADTDWRASNNHSGGSATITGIVEDTTYEWQVRSQCNGGGTSNWSSGQGPDFTTDGNGNNDPNPPSGDCSLPWKGPNYTVSNETDTYSSGSIDISCANDVCIEVDLEGTGNMETADYINVYYKVNGGTQKALSLNVDAFNKKTEKICGVSGNSIEIIIEAKTSHGSETYFISNLEIYEDSGGNNNNDPDPPSNGNCDIDWSDSNYSVSDETSNYSSGSIDMSCVNDVCISVDLQGVGNMETADYINVYYKVNGGSQKALSLNTDSFGKKTEEVCGVSGNSLEIIIEAKTSHGSETYFISNLEVTEDNGNKVSIVSSDLNYLPERSGQNVDESFSGDIHLNDLFDSSQNQEAELQVYPNPVTNILFIEGLPIGQSFQIFGATGKLVMKSIENNVNVSDLDNGIYFIRSKGLQPIRFVKL